MIIYTNMTRVIGFVLLFATNIAFANEEPAVEFFASNNTNEISMQVAYNRLIGQEQDDLQNSMLNIFQKNDVKDGKFEDILGTYRMSSDQNMTADNTEKYNTAPQEPLADEKIFSIAQELAVSLHQDSVAVLIPDQSITGNITVSFVSSLPSINVAIKTLQDKLPPLYSQGFSLHLLKKQDDFDHAQVTEIEWLSSKINLEEVKKAFPLEKVDALNGRVYLVYQNGQKEQL
jgi:hypothetical protein